MTRSILSINGGSSSIKFALYESHEPPRRVAWGKIERIGTTGTQFEAARLDGPRVSRALAASDHAQAVEQLVQWLDESHLLANLAGIGHRIVHGGPQYHASRIIDAAVVAELKRLAPLDPTHLPGEIALVEAFARQQPGVRQVACFDTAFHHDMPRVAQLLPLPRRYEAAGVRRYGFHGLSYTYLMQELTRTAGEAAARGRVVLAHLGGGASMAAVRDGKCIDTTMAFTPAAGLVMSTRTGDLDPGVLTYLMRSEGLDADALDDLISHRSGMLGLSETSSDMRDLLAREADDPRAADAVSVFCYQARKWIGALAAALGGLDTLVFAGGIGEHSVEVRERICRRLGFLGLELDTFANAESRGLISSQSSRVCVRVIATDEESIIVEDVERLV